MAKEPDSAKVTGHPTCKFIGGQAILQFPLDNGQVAEIEAEVAPVATRWPTKSKGK